GLTLTGCRNTLLAVRADSPGRAAVVTPAARGPLRLTDVTGTSGVCFQHTTGAAGRKWFPETNGSGAAIFDYDGDGYPDLFLINGRDWSPAERKAARLPPGPPPHSAPSRLFHNRGDGTFEDVTQGSGLDLPMY